MNVGIIGASGLVGGAVRQLLEEKGHQWVGFSRTPEGREGSWRSLDEGFAGLDAVVNVAGDPINKRWNEENKKRFYQSRVGVTERAVAEIAKLPQEERPKVLFNVSGVSCYGDKGDQILTEQSPLGIGYLSELCEQWEGAAQPVKELGVRLVIGRLGVVLGKKADAWKQMKLVFQMGGGGKLGSGKQYWPWIHLRDVAGGIVFSLENEAVAGVVNLVGPNPVTNAEFTQVLAKSLNRPAIIPVPAFGLKLVLGGFAEALLASCRVIPQALDQAGYRHQFTELEATFADLLKDS